MNGLLVPGVFPPGKAAGFQTDPATGTWDLPLLYTALALSAICANFARVIEERRDLQHVLSCGAPLISGSAYLPFATVGGTVGLEGSRADATSSVLNA